MAWALLGAYVVGIFGTNLLAIWREPALAKERFDAPESAERWDRLITNAVQVLNILCMANL